MTISATAGGGPAGGAAAAAKGDKPRGLVNPSPSGAGATPSNEFLINDTTAGGIPGGGGGASAPAIIGEPKPGGITTVKKIRTINYEYKCSNNNTYNN